MEKINSRTRQRSSLRRRKRFLNLETEKMLEYVFHSAFTNPKFWYDYTSLYNNLFTTDDTAILKAKTHSLINSCKTLKTHNDYSFSVIYNSLLKWVYSSNTIYSKQLLNLKSQYDFVVSLEDLEDSIIVQG